MKIMRFLHFFILFLGICGQSIAQNDFDVESPSEQDIFLYASAQKGEVVGLIPNGETLTSLESLKSADITWHKVKYGEYTGYVDSKYLVESTGTRKAVVTYQQANITKLVLIHAVSQYDGICYLLTIDNNTQKVKIKNRFKCKFGVAGVSKQKEGDKKTPFGHYCVLSESTVANVVETPDDDEIYNKFGGYSIHLNYPNMHDATAKKTGGGICIHGGYSRTTDGCVRIIDEGQEISTKNILTVGNFVTKGTHVVITNSIPATFKQKANTELQADSYPFIQSTCGKVCSHTEWQNQVNTFFANLSETPTPIAPPNTASPANTKPSINTEGYSAGFVKSSTGFANLRQKPNKDSATLERIPSNQPISYKETGAWWEVVSQQGNKGYIHSSLISK